MLHRVFSSLSMRFGAAALLAGLLVLGVIAPVWAQQVYHGVGHPIQVPANHSLRQSLINTGSHPLVVRFLFLNAADFSPIASSSPMMVDAQSGVFFEWSTFPNDAFVLPALEIHGQVNQIVNNRGIIQAHSTQLFDPSGRTVGFSSDSSQTTVGQ